MEWSCLVFLMIAGAIVVLSSVALLAVWNSRLMARAERAEEEARLLHNELRGLANMLAAMHCNRPPEVREALY